jgi:hypothetical protein
MGRGEGRVLREAKIKNGVPLNLVYKSTGAMNSMTYETALMAVRANPANMEFIPMKFKESIQDVAREDELLEEVFKSMGPFEWELGGGQRIEKKKEVVMGDFESVDEVVRWLTSQGFV